MSKEKKFTMSHKGFLQVLIDESFVNVGTFSVGKDTEGRQKQIVNLDISKINDIVKANGTLSGFVNEYDKEKENKVREYKKKLYNE